MGSATSGDTLEVIDQDECLRLLAEQPIGRLGYCIRGTPHIEPVNFAVYEGDVVVNFASPWAPGERPYYMLIKPEQVSGRRIVRSTDTHPS